MKNLILVRHGKSSYENVTDDKSREISAIGIERTIKVALDSKNYIHKNATFWSSSASRAAATALIYAEIYSIALNSIHFKDELYTFDEAVLQKIISEIPNEINSIIIFGHNPAFTNFINNNTNLNIDNLPTSGMVVIEFESNNWMNLPKGKVIKTVFAKDL